METITIKLLKRCRQWRVTHIHLLTARKMVTDVFDMIEKHKQEK